MNVSEFREELGRVLASETFRGSETLKRLLSYLVEATLAGRGESLKEYTIGVEGFAKPPDYDPQADSTIRVQASKLRKKLEEYYRSEGVANPVRISLPKGRFHVLFDAVPAVAPPVLRKPEESRKWKILCAALLAIMIAAVAFAISARHNNVPASDRAAWTPEMQALWAPLVDDSTPLLISFETSLFVVIPGWSLREGTINDQSDVSSSLKLKALLAKLGNPGVRLEYNYAGFGSVYGVFLLTKLLNNHKPQILLERSAALTWEEIRESQLVFIGVGKSKERIRLLLDKGDFQWTYSELKNLKPRNGESHDYRNKMDPETGKWIEQYGLISMLPSVKEGRHVFVIGSGSSEGDWAVAEYVTSPNYVADLVRHLRLPSGKMPDSYQAVVRIRYGTQVPLEMHYVTHHVLDSAAR